MDLEKFPKKNKLFYRNNNLQFFGKTTILAVSFFRKKKIQQTFVKLTKFFLSPNAVL